MGVIQAVAVISCVLSKLLDIYRFTRCRYAFVHTLTWNQIKSGGWQWKTKCNLLSVQYNPPPTSLVFVHLSADHIPRSLFLFATERQRQ